MNREEYLDKILEIDQKIDALNKERERVNHQYIEQNAQFKIGDKVRIDRIDDNGKVFETKFGWVLGFSVSPDGRVVPKLADQKLDGTMHKRKQIWLFGWRNYNITKID